MLTTDAKHARTPANVAVNAALAVLVRVATAASLSVAVAVITAHALAIRLAVASTDFLRNYVV